MQAEFELPFEVIEPAVQHAPVMFNSPHSGRFYPPSFLAASRLDPVTLRRSEDAFVDLLLANVAASGSSLMLAHFPRAYLDVNREPYELDPRMFEGRLPSYANTRSQRVAGGLGTVARVVGEAQEIYQGRLPVSEAMDRIQTLYMPYHHALKRLLNRIHREFGAVLLIDCHSMPSCSLAREARPHPDIVLGDRYGTSCSPVMMERTCATLEAMGYRVARNKPYAGGFITEHYGSPLRGFHVIQIEINRSLYMNEQDFTLLPGFERLKDDLVVLRDALAALPFTSLASYHTAAE